MERIRDAWKADLFYLITTIVMVGGFFLYAFSTV